MSGRKKRMLWSLGVLVALGGGFLGLVWLGDEEPISGVCAVAARNDAGGDATHPGPRERGIREGHEIFLAELLAA
jgi:hypothetical protein